MSDGHETSSLFDRYFIKCSRRAPEARKTCYGNNIVGYFSGVRFKELKLISLQKHVR